MPHSTPKDPEGILRAVLEEHEPVAVFACFSGGHDSLVSTHWTMENAPLMTDVPVRVLHINTGIGIEETRHFVRQTCAGYNWPLWERKAKEGEYEDFVRVHGFPGPGQHARMYQRLKQRVVEAVLREVKQDQPRSARVLFVTDIYAAESQVRAGYQRAVSKRWADVWCNPFYWKPHAFFRRYMEDNSLPQSEVKRRYGHSGECLCGAFADYGERRLLQRHYPAAFERIAKLEGEVRAKGMPWGWADPGPPPTWHAEKHGQLPLDFRPLCHGCGKAA